MKHFFSILLLLTCSIVLHAQPFSVEGRVVNDKDNVPLKGASVFINNGSRGTTTDENGHFILTGISYASFELVVSYISYETILVKVEAENIHKKFLIKMSPKTEELREVIVGGIEKDGWQKWGAVFIKQFIGTSANALKCVIKNPEVLKFRYNKTSGELRVTANDKLILRNTMLGYVINYQLEEFIFIERKGMVTYTGYPYFDTMTTRSKRRIAAWKKERMAAYKGSVMHFMRSFYARTTATEGFDLTYLIRLYKTDTATRRYYNNIMQKNYSNVDTSKFYIAFVREARNFDPVIYISGKQALPADSIRSYDTANKQTLIYFNNAVQVTFKNELESPEYVSQQSPFRTKRLPQTSLFYLVNQRPIVVQANGLYFEPLDVFSEGYWAYEKIAELLPSDYEPRE